MTRILMLIFLAFFSFLCESAQRNEITFPCDRMQYLADPVFKVDVAWVPESGEYRYTYRFTSGEGESPTVYYFRIENIGAHRIGDISGDFTDCTDSEQFLICRPAVKPPAAKFSSRSGSVSLFSRFPPGIGRYEVKATRSGLIYSDVARSISHHFSGYEAALIAIQQAYSEQCDSDHVPEVEKKISGAVIVPWHMSGAAPRNARIDQVPREELERAIRSKQAAMYSENRFEEGSGIVRVIDSAGRQIRTDFSVIARGVDESMDEELRVASIGQAQSACQIRAIFIERLVNGRIAERQAIEPFPVIACQDIEQRFSVQLP